MTTALLQEQEQGVLRLTLNRPERLNAIDIPLLEDLTAALRAAEAMPGVRVIVLGGAGRAFCAGADIGEMIDRRPEDWERIVDHYLDPIRAISRLTKPVIARCHGSVFGGGLGLAMACDLRITSAGARFCTPFVKLALAGCDMSAGYFLPRLVGLGRATEMMLTGRAITADEALASGLVTEVTPEDQLDVRVNSLARQLAAGAPRALAFTKSAIRRSLDRGMEAEFDYEIFAQVQCLQSEDHREGVAAFQGKRAPLFRGS